MTRRAVGHGPVTMLGSGTAQHAPERATAGRRRPPAPKTSPNTSPALSALSEAEFQRIIVAHLRRLGFVVWVVPNMKLTTAGLPDLIFWHPVMPGRLFCWELKREQRAVISPSQQAALAHLQTVPGIDARIVRPSDWPDLRDGLLADAPR